MPQNPAGPLRSLITGVSGFAGGHLATALLAAGERVAGFDRAASERLAGAPSGFELHEGDIRDADDLRAVTREFRPHTIYHLAALTHVAHAWQQRRDTLEINVVGTAAVLEVAAELDPKPTVVVASSGQVYGAVPDDSAPLSEDHPANPKSPYGVSKLCSEHLARQAWDGEGVRTVILRTFNYTGPWQSPDFVCSDFARQVARIEAGLAEARLTVGNLEARRDFSDVRDIIDGYRLAAARGEPGRVYNLASGQAVKIADVLDKLCRASEVQISVRQDPDRLRPADLSLLRGDATRARRELGWQPRCSLDETLLSVLDFWRQRVGEDGGGA